MHPAHRSAHACCFPFAAAVLAAGASACSLTSPAGTASAGAAPLAKPPSESLVERGKHLVLTSACNDCHTPLKLGANGPEPDFSRMLSGHPQDSGTLPPAKLAMPWMGASNATNTAWAGPWGISHTANLTPDRETGLGAWTLENFVGTLKTGRHMGQGREILPPMPIPSYQNFTRDEMEAIFSYLQSIPAIKNRVPEPVPPGQ
jgi:hypothetical protein